MKKLSLVLIMQASTRSSQSILKEITPEYSMEELMLKLKLQILWEPTHWKRP